MLNLKWRQGATELIVPLPSDDCIVIPCSCLVRNLTNKWRGRDEVARTMPGEEPYNPQIFPVGKWDISMPLRKTDSYKEPFFIPTNAERSVNVWALDNNGEYAHRTGRTVIDKAYGLHFSTSNTTLGCIKIENRNDLLFLVNIIQAELQRGEACKLEVTK